MNMINDIVIDVSSANSSNTHALHAQLKAFQVWDVILSPTLHQTG